MTSSSMAFQSGASSSSSSSSSPSIHPWNYDVFLSFRGEDVRHNFISHLYQALDQRGINTYIDNNLESGKAISQALLKAIEESTIAIIIFSQNYASSTWCLDELMKILDCNKTRQQIVLPVFYNVDPSEVRHQRKSFGEAFAKHQHRFNDDMKVQRWKETLEEVANLSGFHLGNRNESEFIEEIVKEVSRIVNPLYLSVAKYPVGIESHIRYINWLLRIGMNDRRMIGILGIGGIGKTIVLYIVMFFKDIKSCWRDIGCNAKITTNGSNHVCCIKEGVQLVNMDWFSSTENTPGYAVWVGYSNLQSFELKVLDNLRVQFVQFDPHPRLNHDVRKLVQFYKSCRAKVVYKNEWRANKKRKMDEVSNHFIVDAADGAS